ALKNLGNWYAADSLNERAAGYYERALALDPQDANLHYNLGRLYIQFLGKPGPGALHLRTSLELDPGQPQAEAIRQTLDYLKSAGYID
ncbi:MAG: tetratricopeptide repeat protein, partial [Candidatus Glassbacteria bacterium]